MTDLIEGVDSYYGVPVLMVDGGEWLLTSDPRRAWAALNRFHREICGTTTRAYWEGHVPEPQPAWIRPEPDGEGYYLQLATANGPQAIHAYYIGEGYIGE